MTAIILGIIALAPIGCFAILVDSTMRIGERGQER